MTFPNPELTPFEGDNKQWCNHAAGEFTRTVTSPLLAAPDWDPAHGAMAHMIGFVICAMVDAGKRGDGEQQIMPDLLEKIRPMINGLVTGEVIVTIGDNAGPLLTVLTGGKKDE
ncbi:hypothetical protein X766_31020 [Mesorhizobium sp. LSJC255A00]|uniref:hypothetical protein n=1 Tax=Mesorhizobium sp. LSJC255A00 TaxID=1287313 RepID=UPI0003CE8725|nr:hypothetical protein [Mesorhizobium sp. LSJC255A00]ESX12054.1 hypothetical protein X766_31020 [Mesorhizobium sp. LSJC255A00]